MASARAIATRCCWPPESACGSASARSSRPTRRRSVRQVVRPGSRQAQHPPRRLGDVVDRRQVREQVEALEHHSHPQAHRTQRRGVGALAHPGAQPLARHLHLAGIERREVVEPTQQRRLAAPRGTDDGEHLAAAHVEIDPAQDLRLTAPRVEAAGTHHDVGHVGTGARWRSRRRASRASG
jgi:hypothetical protein